eukprot:Hpha_TRINITY_DN15122_c1_g11::TRINITY_DN15122_c1_g11_i1::g.129551::m.129551
MLALRQVRCAVAPVFRAAAPWGLQMRGQFTVQLSAAEMAVLWAEAAENRREALWAAEKRKFYLIGTLPRYPLYVQKYFPAEYKKAIKAHPGDRKAAFKAANRALKANYREQFSPRPFLGGAERKAAHVGKVPRYPLYMQKYFPAEYEKAIKAHPGDRKAAFKAAYWAVKAHYREQLYNVGYDDEDCGDYLGLNLNLKL